MVHYVDAFKSTWMMYPLSKFGMWARVVVSLVIGCGAAWMLRIGMFHHHHHHHHHHGHKSPFCSSIILNFAACTCELTTRHSLLVSWCAMAIFSRLSWIFNQLALGRACRLSICTHCDRCIYHFSLLPLESDAGIHYNTFAMMAVQSLMQSLEGIIAVDRGHTHSSGCSKVTIVCKPLATDVHPTYETNAFDETDVNHIVAASPNGAPTAIVDKCAVDIDGVTSAQVAPLADALEQILRSRNDLKDMVDEKEEGLLAALVSKAEETIQELLRIHDSPEISYSDALATAMGSMVLQQLTPPLRSQVAEMGLSVSVLFENRLATRIDEYIQELFGRLREEQAHSREGAEVVPND